MVAGKRSGEDFRNYESWMLVVEPLCEKLLNKKPFIDWYSVPKELGSQLTAIWSRVKPFTVQSLLDLANRGTRFQRATEGHYQFTTKDVYDYENAQFNCWQV